MYGLFYLKKNNITNVILLFKLKYESQDKCIELEVSNWSRIKSFNPNVMKIIREKVKNSFSKPYRVYYRTIQNDTYLKRTMKELNIKIENLNNPLVQVSNLDLNIENLLNIKPNLTSMSS